MRIMLIDNSGGGLVEQLDVASGTTLEQLLHQLVPGTAPDDHTVLVIPSHCQRCLDAGQLVLTEAGLAACEEAPPDDPPERGQEDSP